MKRIIPVLLLLFLFTPNLYGADKPKQGGTLPDLKLAGSLQAENLIYLGTENSGPDLSLSNIKSEYVLIEVFSMYCPFCQKEAPHINELFKMILASDKKDLVKMIGIGVGNSQFEVDLYRKKYSVEFPLFTDADFSLHKEIGEVGTPYFILAKKKGDNTYEVLLTQEGPFKDLKAFYQSIIDSVNPSK